MDIMSHRLPSRSARVERLFSKGVESDHGHNEHVFRLDPREWNGFFSKGIESDNGHDDNGRIIRLDPREWEGFEPALPASKPILETKAFSGDELLSRAFGEADPLDSSAGLPSDNATYSSMVQVHLRWIPFMI